MVTLQLSQRKQCLYCSYDQIDIRCLHAEKDHKFSYTLSVMKQSDMNFANVAYVYEGWNFNSGNYLFTTDTK